ncbi:hypothetical protein I5Q96_11165 [Serratia marcescens]|nr:hypothetical protein [Serratia marcescens]MBH3041561.1 hypothetical protein [Serratia marcescens]
MMDNKLSELSKPTACRNKHTGRTFNATENTEPQIYESLYSQEYVSALLARIAWLESELSEWTECKHTGYTWHDRSGRERCGKCGADIV